LRSRPQANGTAFTWIRRSRIDGDVWDVSDIPLGEETESYALQISVNGELVREVVLPSPEWIYPVAMQAVDGAAGGYDVSVAQLSARFGRGPFRTIMVGA
jgi:hypothetical protein